MGSYRIVPFVVPNGEQTFLDLNGSPLQGGQVFFYTPGTTVPANTYTDQTLSVVNPNPLTLDQAGRCVAWADGYLRQVVHDMFGNLVWDRTTGIQIDHIYGDLGIDGILVVLGAATFESNVGVAGALGVTGPGEFGSTLQVDGTTLLEGVLTANSGITSPGNIYGAGIVGNLGLYANVINSLPSPNNLDFIQVNAGWDVFAQGAETDISRFYGTDASVINVSNSTIHIVSGNNPTFSMGNTTSGDNMGSWLDAALEWGICTGAGRPLTSLMHLDLSGNLTVSGTVTSSGGGGGPVTFPDPVTFAAGGNCAIFNGDIVPSSAHGSNVGNAAAPWGGVWASNFITASTDAAGSLMAGGALNLVMATPVKMEPHVGISAQDASKMEGAVAEGAGTDTNALVGYLWKAVQELKIIFDSYATSRP